MAKHRMTGGHRRVVAGIPPEAGTVREERAGGDLGAGAAAPDDDQGAEVRP